MKRRNKGARRPRVRRRDLWTDEGLREHFAPVNAEYAKAKDAFMSNLMDAIWAARAARAIAVDR